MSDHNNNTHTYVERETPRRSGSSAGIAFVLGGVVVVVALLAWAFWGDLVPGEAGDGADVSVSVEGDGADDAAQAVEGAAESVEGAADSVGEAAQDTAND